ncbi:NAD(P)H-quinone oxidoreductase [Devosia naphthalenivorans]|uniref:NAD(P)H-quinone oxidoreductase n=1 Tax=Devosia naphthalenivorans TaxID=2082392 RepID=UPI001FE9F3D4|nr:NAD(P)H-quinone oxidoreductase [Devosia naphthalenivorans]
MGSKAIHLPNEMAVVEMRAPGGPEVLVLGRRQVPAPAAGEVLIEVAAAGVNGPDMMQRKGLYPPPAGASDLMGLEVSGIIVAVGAGVTAWAVGDSVTALTNGGGYAEYCAVDSRHCLPIPENVSVQDAAGLPETFFTVWSNIFSPRRLQPGASFLVHGGAGGIGSTAIQLGKALGAKVYATESPAARCDFCRDLGADRVIDYANEDFVGVLREEAGGADVILDIVGGSYVARNIKASAPGAHIVQIAFALGSKIEIDLVPIMLKRLTYTGSTLRSRSPEFKAEIAAELRSAVWPHFASGKIRTLVGRVLPFSQAVAAHQLMEQAGHLGKILLVPDAHLTEGTRHDETPLTGLPS